MNKSLTFQSDNSLQGTIALAQIFVDSGYFNVNVAQATIKILAGREFGLGPYESLCGIYIIKGKTIIDATLMRTMIKRSPDHDYKVIELTDQVVEIEFYFHDQLLGTSIYTYEDARMAGKANEITYKKHMRNMLMSRATSNGVKWFCPELLGAPSYTQGEFENHEPNDYELNIDTQQEKIIKSEWLEVSFKNEFISFLDDLKKKYSGLPTKFSEWAIPQIEEKFSQLPKSKIEKTFFEIL